MDVGGLLRNSFQAGLVYFNNWIDKQAGGNADGQPGNIDRCKALMSAQAPPGGF